MEPSNQESPWVNPQSKYLISATVVNESTEMAVVFRDGEVGIFTVLVSASYREAVFVYLLPNERSLLTNSSPPNKDGGIWRSLSGFPNSFHGSMGIGTDCLGPCE